MSETLNGQVLDRRIPTDFTHAEKYPARRHAVLSETPATVELILNVPRQYRNSMDQRQDGACVGFSQSWMMSILNRQLYDALWLYREAQLIDEWTDTPPAEGTSLRAGFDVLREKGHCRVRAGKTKAPVLDAGIAANRWATSVDEVRAAIASGIPVNFGVNWYRQFSNPEQMPRLDDEGVPLTEFGIRRFDWYIGNVPHWGPIDGGHAITCVGASDRRQALALCNTWGFAYPFLVWLPYASAQRLLGESGEAGIVTDR
jgi:hypothetical protein